MAIILITGCDVQDGEDGAVSSDHPNIVDRGATGRVGDEEEAEEVSAPPTAAFPDEADLVAEVDPQLAGNCNNQITDCYWANCTNVNNAGSGVYTRNCFCDSAEHYSVLSGGCFNSNNSTTRMIRSNPFENGSQTDHPENNECANDVYGANPNGYDGVDGITGWSCVYNADNNTTTTVTALCCLGW
jgi:hypothetical protein